MKIRRTTTMASLLFCCLLPTLNWIGCSDDRGSNSQKKVLDPLDLLPEAGEISGWTPQGDPQEWIGEALYQPINGAAEIYLRYGFQEAAFQDYQGSGSWSVINLSVQVFRQESAAQAKALYQDPGSGTGTPWTDSEAAGAEARTEQYPLSCSLDFYQNEFFVHIDIASGDDQALDVIKLFARNIVDKII